MTDTLREQEIQATIEKLNVALKEVVKKPMYINAAPHSKGQKFASRLRSDEAEKDTSFQNEPDEDTDLSAIERLQKEAEERDRRRASRKVSNQGSK
jgi:hypothetical protein